MTELVWGRLFFCHTCKKYLEDESVMRGHQLLEHKAESYVSMPKRIDIEKSTTDGKNFNIEIDIKDQIKQDYADVEEIEQDAIE